MPQVTVTLTVVADQIVAYLDPATLNANDWITFRAGDANIYDVRIAETALFNTIRSVLKYQVYDRNPQDTPTTRPNGPNSTTLNYIVDATTADNAITINPVAPPRIIINSHV